MPKFYRYLLYRFYSWRLEEGDDIPVATVIFSMSGNQLFHFFSIYGILARFFPSIGALLSASKPADIMFIISFIAVYYLLVYKKEKWIGFSKEFKDETPKQRWWGSVFVYSFTIGSILLFF